MGVQPPLLLLLLLKRNQATKDSILKISTSLLGGDHLLDSLGTSVGLVYLGPLPKQGSLQVPTVVHITGSLVNGTLHSLKVLVHGNHGLALFGLCASLGGSLDDQTSTVILGADNIAHLGIGNSRILELVQRLDVALFGREGNGARTLGLSVSLLDERVVASGNFPNQRIRTVHHLDVIVIVGVVIGITVGLGVVVAAAAAVVVVVQDNTDKGVDSLLLVP